MERRSRSASPRRNNRNGSNGPGAGNAGGSRYYRRYSRSRSRSRERSRDQNSRRRTSRSRSRDRYRRGGSSENDLYRDLINDDYSEDKNYPSRGYDNRQYRGPGRDYGREYDRDYDRDRDRGDRRDYRNNRYNRRYNPDDRDDMHSDDSDESYNNHYYNKTPSNTIIVMGLLQHITEADIMSALIQVNMPATSIRLIRKRNTGASRGFAFVEFKTIDEAARWMELTQSVLVLQDQSRATLQYSHSREQAGIKLKSNATDWYCAKCGVFNFKRRFSCFKCYASREESERGGEGSDEVSNILTKKIMFRNLDALTNEESVLTAMQLHVPDLAQKVSKIMVSRDALTQTSRGICYLYFESLVDSMNIHNALTALEPPLTIDNREVLITYCMDHENRQIVPKKAIGGVGAVAGGGPGAGGGGGGGVGPGAGGGCGGGGVGGSCGSGDAGGNAGGSMNPADIGNVNQMASGTMSITSCGPGGIVSGAAGAAAAAGANQYTLADVPRLAEYSAAMYASTPAESAHFVKYYTDYYISEINKGQFANLPSMAQVNETSANSGAAVALSAIQRKQKKMNSIETTATQAAAAAAMAAAQVKAAIAAQSIITPKGNDGKSYPTPDVSQYQYDETSGYYYDPTTGLYYDAHSQYYYNSETGAYLYWDQRKSTYVLATPASAAAAVKDVVQQETMAGVGDDSGKSMPASAEDETKKEKRDANKPDKVKVAKKIVKDMEKWAKQLNQKKDYTVVATPQPILTSKLDDCTGSGGGVGGSTATARAQGGMGAAGGSGGSGSRLSSAYADVGFSILEKKERAKLSDYVTSSASGVSVGSGGGAGGGGGGGGGGSAGGAGGGGIANKLASPYGSDSEDEHAVALASSSSASKGGSAPADSSERDCVDFQKLTCLLCKRAFQSLDILQKHLKMSNLHKENLLKYNMTLSKDEPDDDGGAGAGLSYRDRAKERRLKYGESDPPPPNRSRERFENEIKSMTSRQKDTTPAMPIGSNNVGNRLLQKMGWSEGQGLGRKNQGRTNIIEANARSSTAGLGTKSGLAPGDDYKTYIKKMMKSRYESV